MRIMLFAALLTLPATAVTAQQATAPAASSASGQGSTPQRIRNVQLQQGQACPRGTSAEIIVCSTIEEPYRIPKQFRDDGPIAVPNQSWVNRAADMDATGRQAAGLPDTCSAIGSGGQTGCTQMWNRQYAAEKRAQARAAESVPGSGR